MGKVAPETLQKSYFHHCIFRWSSLEKEMLRTAGGRLPTGSSLRSRTEGGQVEWVGGFRRGADFGGVLRSDPTPRLCGVVGPQNSISEEVNLISKWMRSPRRRWQKEPPRISRSSMRTEARIRSPKSNRCSSAKKKKQSAFYRLHFTIYKTYRRVQRSKLSFEAIYR